MVLGVALPRCDGDERPERTIDFLDGKSTAVQRRLRRSGLAGHEPSTMATLLAYFDSLAPGFVFLDIGANIGLYSVLCRSLFSPSRVIAFEPRRGQRQSPAGSPG